MAFDFDKHAENWPELMDLKRAAKETGLSVGYLANLLSKGEGFGERLKIGRRNFFPKSAVLDFMKARCSAHIVTTSAMEEAGTLRQKGAELDN